MELQHVNYSAFWKALFVLIFAFQVTHAQKDSISTSGKSTFIILQDDANIALGGVREVFLSPLHWQKQNLFIAGAVGLGTGILYTADERSSEFFMNQQEDVPQMLLDIGRYGSPEIIFGLNSAVYLSGLVFKNEKLRHTGLLLVTSTATSGLILSATKILVGRARPITGEGRGEFRPFNFNDDQYKSFPSGHALFSFSTAYAIGKGIDNPFVKASVYGLGLVGPITRLWEGEHWLTDVAVSMALSIAVVETIDRHIKKQQDISMIPERKLSWNFYFGPTAIGLSGTF